MVIKMKKVNEWMLKKQSKMVSLLNNQRGSQTLEWIGIAAVIVILVGVISTAMSNAGSIGDEVVKKITELIQNIG
ncbi:hypothetical protein JCM21714_3621 [Gracilibacillus boraciitolerans JCM 21714]|uniref:Uncharacterized protein n=2 Tax=Gracilibacillus boraciitolerans TaxID=307521 RepID=W4VNR5_9BACI|nr:hypothetical protein JCM21714_3621 [Gracilibacillus boraciitolerans JCM 21714]